MVKPNLIIDVPVLTQAITVRSIARRVFSMDSLVPRGSSSGVLSAALSIINVLFFISHNNSAAVSQYTQRPERIIDDLQP
jgi:hypothetical protein